MVWAESVNLAHSIQNEPSSYVIHGPTDYGIHLPFHPITLHPNITQRNARKEQHNMTQDKHLLNAKQQAQNKENIPTQQNTTQHQTGIMQYSTTQHNTCETTLTFKSGRCFSKYFQYEMFLKNFETIFVSSREICCKKKYFLFTNLTPESNKLINFPILSYLHEFEKRTE